MDDPRRTAMQRRAQTARMVDTLGIEWDTLPSPPFWDFSKNTYRLYVADSVINGQVLLKREFTQDEKNAVAYHSAKKRVTLAYATPVSLVGAYYAQRRGRATFRFPFWTPRPTSFNPSRFPFPNTKMPSVLQGAPAMGAWHVMRGACYYFFIKTAVSAFLSIYATSVEVASMSRDARLKEVGKELGQRNRGARGRPALPGRTAPPEDPSMRDADFQQGHTHYEGYTMSDNAERAESTGAYDSSAYSSPPRQPQQRQQTRPTQTYPPTQTPPSSDGLNDGGLFDDDASPVAPTARGQPVSSSSGGSAWDRIRRQAVGSSSSGAAQSGGDSQASDAYAYAQSDRDSAMDRERAQREFDAMLERERQAESGDRYRRN